MRDLSFGLKIILYSFCMIVFLHAEGVKGKNDLIRFDVNDDAIPEAILNSVGLGIGLSPSTNLHVAGNSMITGTLTIGSAISGTSNLHLNGTLAHAFQTISANATLNLSSVVLVNSSSDNIKISLPYAGNVTGRVYTVKRVSSLNRVWLCSEDLIDGHESIGLIASSNTLASIELLSSDNTWHILSSLSASEPWSPSQLTTSLWLDANDSTTITANVSNVVSQWNDKSGSGHDFVQSTESNKPTLTTVGGNTALYFDGVNTRMTSTANLMNIVGSGNNASVYFCLPLATSIRGLFHARGTARFQVRDATQWMMGTYAGADPGVGVQTNLIAGMQRDTNGDVSYSVNGTYDEDAYSDATTLQDGATLKIGESDGILFTGYYGELIVAPSHLSTSDRQKLEGYLAHKWGLTTNLPDNHPYKNIPPFI